MGSGKTYSECLETEFLFLVLSWGAAKLRPDFLMWISERGSK